MGVGGGTVRPGEHFAKLAASGLLLGGKRWGGVLKNLAEVVVLHGGEYLRGCENAKNFGFLSFFQKRGGIR